MPDRAAPSEVVIRERRLGSITGYEGTAQDLLARSHDGSVVDRTRSFSQCGTCSSLCSTLQLSLIQDAVVINHAPLGCAADFPMFNLYNRYGLLKRGMSVNNARLISTNLDESDVIFGATAKLLETIREAHRRYHPSAIFVTASCASGIIGEDLDSVLREAEVELGIPVAAVHCEGFRSQVWATGFDAAYHAILEKIVKPPKTKRPELINVITFLGDDYFAELFEPLGLKSNPIVPYLSIENLARISEAGATAQMCATLGTYFAAGLERRFGVPEVKSPPPYGLAGTDAFLRELGRILGKEREVESFIAAERAAIADELQELRAEFTGVKAFVAAGPAHGHSFMSVLQDLGMVLVGSCMFHHDPHFDNGDIAGDSLNHVVKTHGNVRLGICNKQSFELVSLIRKLKPDVLVMRHPSVVVWGAKLGIPTFFIDDENYSVGYRGLVRYGRKIRDWLRNPAIERTLARHTRLPYTEWWLERGRDPFTFLAEPQP
jgi:nitrogenase molybdenum-iron protein alpha chain